MAAVLEIHVGDITLLHVDAIVNAANAQLARGGGVCGAIHRAAGPDLEQACLAIGSCPTGEARITPGFSLPAKWVIHAVGPVWQGGGQNEDGLLASAYRQSIQIAEAHEVASIAFPAISTGIYGFPLELATAVAVTTVHAETRQSLSVRRAVFACFDERTAWVYRRVLDQQIGSAAPL